MLTFLILQVWFILTNSENIYGHHSFRQAQTALAVHWLMIGEAQIDYLPVLGYPWQLPMEFPLFQYYVANISKLTGISHFYVTRLNTLLFTLLTVFVLWKYIKEKFWFCMIFLSSPLLVYYSSGYLIEALCTLLLCLNITFFCKYRDSKLKYDLYIILISFCLLSLQKVTYAIPLLVIYVLYEIFDYREKNWVLKEFIFKSLLLSIASLPIVLWLMYSNDVKSMGYLTQMEIGSANTNWIFGSWEQRIDPKNWIRILTRLLVLGSGMLIIIGINNYSEYRKNNFVVVSLTYTVLSVGLFFNLYVAHDYYLIPVVTLLLASLFTHSYRNLSRLLIIFAFLLNIPFNYYWSIPKILMPANDVGPLLKVSGVINELNSDKESALIVFGNEWDSTIALNTGMHVVSIPSSTEQKYIDPDYIAGLPDDLVGNKKILGIVVCERWLEKYGENEWAVYRRAFGLPKKVSGCEYIDGKP